MGKGDRRTRAKKSKANWEAAVSLAPVPKKQPNGDRRDRSDAPRDPRKTALDARCRIFGMRPNRKNRDALSGQHNGSQIGMVMQARLRPHEIPKIWSAWQGFASAERTYRLRYLGLSGSAKGASIAMVPGRIETDQSHSVDLREPEQKDRDAVSNYMRWRGFIGQMDASQQVLLYDLEKDREGALWDEGPTMKGVATLAALKVLAQIVERG